MQHDELSRKALARLYYLRNSEKDQHRRWLLQRTIEDVEDAKISADEAIEEAKMIGVRNPAFDGDMVGWLDDDFDDEEDEDDKKKKPK
jgi:hypothetical protein